MRATLVLYIYSGKFPAGEKKDYKMFSALINIPGFGDRTDKLKPSSVTIPMALSRMFLQNCKRVIMKNSNRHKFSFIGFLLEIPYTMPVRLTVYSNL